MKQKEEPTESHLSAPLTDDNNEDYQEGKFVSWNMTLPQPLHEQPLGPWTQALEGEGRAWPPRASSLHCSAAITVNNVCKLANISSRRLLQSCGVWWEIMPVVLECILGDFGEALSSISSRQMRRAAVGKHHISFMYS